jgi:predicted DNA-binding transcriptional regulator YafY
MPLRPIPRPKAARLGRAPGKFTQSRRLDHLRAQLEAHTAGLSLDDMAGILRVSTRSVRRYLRELGLVTELESVAIGPGAANLWRIKPSERGRAVNLRRAQAYGLLAPRRVFEVLRGSALFDEIDLGLRQVEQVAHRPAARTGVRGDVPAEARLEDRFAFVPPMPRVHGSRGEDVDAVFQAVADSAVLRFRYRDEGADGGQGGTPAPAPARDGKGGAGARITAHAYALVLHAGTVTCIGHDVDRRTTRAFLFDRMSDVVASEAERFELPADFVLDDWLQGDFGVARAPRLARVLVEFDPRAAEVVRGRKVHASQRVALAPDGRARVSFAVPHDPRVMAAVRAWILGFGASARVLEPRELADDVADELRRAAARYD